MNVDASPPAVEFHGDALLGALLDALEPYAARPLVLEYGERRIQPGYHVTEVKAGSFVTLDCGGNPDRWRETVIQIEDLPAEAGGDYMLAGKFRSILDRVTRRVELAADARLTFEVGMPDEPMRVFDVDAVQPGGDHVVLRLAARPAICKPRHRAAQQAVAGACCGASVAKPGCCWRARAGPLAEGSEASASSVTLTASCRLPDPQP
ncbi:DUF6428 family protein [Bosea thiooxidans]